MKATRSRPSPDALTVANEPDMDHITCCEDDDLALCGYDLSSVPWAPILSSDPVCGVCDSADLAMVTDDDCSRCPRDLLGGAS